MAPFARTGRSSTRRAERSLSSRNDALAQRLIEETGQQAHLISIARDEAPSERTISTANFDAVLAGNCIRDAPLGGASSAPARPKAGWLDWIVVYAMVERDSFPLADLLAFLEQAASPLAPRASRIRWPALS